MARGVIDSPLLRVVNGLPVSLINAPVVGRVVGAITLLNLNGQDRSGHAIADRDAGGSVSVTVHLAD